MALSVRRAAPRLPAASPARGHPLPTGTGSQGAPARPARAPAGAHCPVVCPSGGGAQGRGAPRLRVKRPPRREPAARVAPVGPRRRPPFVCSLLGRSGLGAAAEAGCGPRGPASDRLGWSWGRGGWAWESRRGGGPRPSWRGPAGGGATKFRFRRRLSGLRVGQKRVGRPLAPV